MGLVAMTCVVLGGFSASAMAGPSDLDSAFGSGGKAIVDFGGSEVAFADALQPDGKLLVAGETSAGAAPHNFAVARLNPDGSPDAAFGEGGKTTVDFGGGDDTALAVAVAPDGKILLAGQSTGASGIPTFALARLNSDGSLDASFGNGDHTIIDVGGDDLAQAAVLQSDGRIVVAGNSTAGSGGHNSAAARLNPDGSVDSSFGTGGKVTVDFGGDEGASAVVAQPDGKIILAGDTTAGAGAGDLAVARLGATGSLDASFGTGGKTTIDFGGQEIGRAVVAQPDGAIIVAGGTTAGAGGGDFAVARLSSAGLLDGSFGGDGKTTVDFGGDDAADAVALQPDGKILLAGTGAGANFAVARLTGDAGGGGGGGGGTTPPAPIAATPCHGGLVLALVHGRWSCVRVSGIDDGLLPRAADLPGYRSAGGGSNLARGALGGSVPRALRSVRPRGAAFRAGSRGLSVGVFVFSTSRRAASGLRALAKGRRRVVLGRGLHGLLRTQSKRRTTDVAVAFSVGGAIGTVRLRARGRLAGATAAVVAYAQGLAARM